LGKYDDSARSTREGKLVDNADAPITISLGFTATIFNPVMRIGLATVAVGEVAVGVGEVAVGVGEVAVGVGAATTLVGATGAVCAHPITDMPIPPIITNRNPAILRLAFMMSQFYLEQFCITFR
jgi:hypothetical protein